VADPVPVEPKKERGPLRWILLGCGVLTGLLLLGFGGCAGLFYFIYRGSDDTAKIAEAYLRNAPELRNVIDPHAHVERNWTGWSISVVNDGGSAHFPFTIKHDDGRPTEAVVWLIRSAGQWRALGARVRPPGGAPIEIGKPPKERSHHSFDWD
jgi:hypothetical protein